ncbi:flagellar motor switch protein FliM [Rickettsiales endosymbiont of Stachyamoeba lipophora]|uniref:flagellar motor switch protein FliM n=1 Tax=Rickettsiales endosymbiont of Stachyamoeba lipophora TaxID=2486578 RepID=UPI000F64DC81|nr:flagellar motor switch protein FliM [Rickettsiales endosymbiont of Stachyamoeba lipophora]AZL15667.1 flagellar motor switch protein FliM [Rickettsiales endosymbiont of Stachyamoeba lipophora]
MTQDTQTIPQGSDQSNIDNLPEGNADSKPGVDGNEGFRFYVDRSMKSYQRLPMLEVVCDRFTRILSTTLRNVTSENVDIELRGITSLRFGDYINSIPLPALVSIFKVVEWDNLGLITPNGQFIYSMVDILFGGRKQGNPIRFDGKPFTNIELNVFKYICDIILNDLTTSFEPLNPSTFVFERIETNPRFASIARPGDPVILIELYIKMEERDGKVEILIPYATLEPIRELLLQVILGEKFGKDNNWENHIQNEMYNAHVELEAILATKDATLLEIAKMKPGQTIIFDKHPEDEVTLACEKIDLMSCKLGGVEEKIAVSVEKAIHRKLIEIME